MSWTEIMTYFFSTWVPKYTELLRRIVLIGTGIYVIGLFLLLFGSYAPFLIGGSIVIVLGGMLLGADLFKSHGVLVATGFLSMSVIVSLGAVSLIGFMA